MIRFIVSLALCFIAVSLPALEPLPLMDAVTVGGTELQTKALPEGLVLREDIGLIAASAVNGQVVHRTQTRVLETRATITPKGDYLLMFPEGDHYAKSKGEKINSMMACRSTDHGRTWSKPVVAYDVPYGQHGFVPLIPRGTQRIYCFGTQPVPGKWTWENGQRENAPIGCRWSDDDGHTWSETKLIAPVNDSGFMGMSVMRMTETDAGTWLIGSHLADWSVKPFTTQQYILRSEDKGATWTVLPGARPNGWVAEGFNRMDEGRPLNLGGGKVLFMSRTPQGHLFTAWSSDDGKTWTKPAPSTLVHPDAPPMVFPLSDGKTLVAFHHNKAPSMKSDELSDKAETMKMRSEVWASLSTDEGHTWSAPRFVLANAVAPIHAVSGFNSQCSYIDAFTEDGVLHLFMPHRWQQVLHLTIDEDALARLPAKARLQTLAAPKQPVSTSELSAKRLRLPAVISDHMVLQANKPATIWGWADAGDVIEVEFAGQTKSTKANVKGEWQVKLDPMPASGKPGDLIVSSHLKSQISNLRCTDVLVGEVWLASGQSNMEMQINGKMHGKVDNADAAIAEAKHPRIRLFVHDAPFAIYELPAPPDEPLADRPGKWIVCSPETVAEFTAMGYFVARDIMNVMHTPVGILSASVGGTPIEAWTGIEPQRREPSLKPLLDDWAKRLDGFDPAKEQSTFLEKKTGWLKQRSAALKANQPAPKAPSPFKNIGVMKPGRLFNGVIAPLVPYTVRGCLWYQGERNANGPFTGLYGEQMKILINDWRTRWHDDFYFAWVQLPASSAPQKLPSEPAGWGVSVREGQMQALVLPHTGMAITMDIGDPKQGHPTNKADFAARLSRVVLHDVYHQDIAIWSGPAFKSVEFNDGKATLTFDHGEGLKAKSGTLEGFAIAGEDKKFVWADAKVEGDRVIVSNADIPSPKAVRYAWASNPKGNLVNAADLPASPFRTDTWGSPDKGPLFETQCLYPITPGNKPNYRIPSIIQAPNGDVLVVCEKRNDGIGDIGNHDIVMKRSADRGRTWSAEQVILDDADRVCTDITIGIDRDTRKLWLFFLRDKKKFACLTSTDSGATWQGPVVIHEQVTLPAWDQLQGKADDEQPTKGSSHVREWERAWSQRYGCGPGHAMVQLKSGRLLVPARHREDIGGGRLRSFAHSFYSDDHGATWHLGGTIGIHTSECQFVELNDGSVRVISRNESSDDAPDNLRHLTAISRDGGVTWTDLHRLEELITPRCHGSVERFDADTLLFCSPASPIRQPEHPYGRYNLTVRASHDDGATWSAGRTLWPHPGSYSDIAVLDDHSIAMVYERSNKGSTHYWDELYFVRFGIEWLERR